jgi:hypothetical protein
MTFFEYQKIFENVISDGEYTPYALLKKDNKIIGVLKFREFAYCLHFEDMIDTHNKLIAYKGLISHPRLEKYFKTELLQSLNKDSVGIINLHSGLTIFPVIMIYANYDKHYQEYIRSSDYFTSKNIHEKIERFQSKTEEKMKQKETRIFEYNDGLYNHS